MVPIARQASGTTIIRTILELEAVLLKILNCIFALLLCVSALHAEKSFPFIGEVQVNNSLNVRIGADRNARKLGSLRNKDRVVVLGEDKGFYKLQFPKQLKAWISGAMLLENGDKEDDMVIRRNVNVRGGPSMEYPVISKLDKGMKVKVIEKNKKDWVRIGAPADAVAWASKKFIRIGESVAVAQEKAEAEGTANSLLKSALTEYKTSFDSKAISEETYLGIKEKFDKILALNVGPEIKNSVRENLFKLEKFRHINRIREVKEEEKKLFDARAALLNEKHQTEVTRLKDLKKEPTRKYDFEGFVDDIGGILFRPATHKLKKGNKVVLYLKSDDIDLNEYVDKRVGVIGEIKRFRGWGRILFVKEIEVLYAPPSQFWSEEEED